MTTSKPKQSQLHPSVNTNGISDASADLDRTLSIARVAAVDRDQYVIRNAEAGDRSEVPAKLTGRAAHACESPVGMPCVGDWVRVHYHDAGAHASILDVLPRQSFLRRKRPGEPIEFQMIAANIDVAFIVQSCHFDFNVRRLERYLVMTSEGHIEPVILLTKTDLFTPAVLEELVARIRHAGIGAGIIALSNVSGAGIDQIRAMIQPGKTYCLLGSSGVGKTTLINRLVGGADLATGAVSHSGEGRHTTTRRQLIALECGGFLIDMPGMRELGMVGVAEGLDERFADIQGLALDCRFANCTHTGEPGCAIQRAIAQGALAPAHFQSYLKLKKESEFHDLSQLEKRKKDRAFGKMVRAVTQAKGRRNGY